MIQKNKKIKKKQIIIQQNPKSGKKQSKSELDIKSDLKTWRAKYPITLFSYSSGYHLSYSPNPSLAPILENRLRDGLICRNCCRKWSTISTR